MLFRFLTRSVTFLCMNSLFMISSVYAIAPGHAYLSFVSAASTGWVGQNNPQITYYSGGLNDAYPPTGTHTNAAQFGGNGGYEFVGKGRVPAIAIGLGLYGTPVGYTYRGQVIETALGDAPNTLYNYRYTINSTRLMVETQFTWMVRSFTPFINLGIGPTWNHLNNYHEFPVSSTGFVAVRPFRSNTVTNFAYQAGLGIGYAFSFFPHTCDFKSERISVGYRYENLGNNSFGTRGSVYPYALKVGRLQTNDVYMTYTHLF